MTPIKDLIEAEIKTRELSDLNGAPMAIWLGITSKSLKKIAQNIDDNFLNGIDKLLEEKEEKELLLRIEYHLHSLVDTTVRNGKTNQVKISSFKAVREKAVELDNKKVNIEFGTIEIRPVE